ncbi:MAG: GIY-YIG nuclease family protein [Puniceicoccaceae bacterium]
MVKSYRVYILRNPAGRRYIGISEDPAQRLVQHNAGKSKWTAKFKPWSIEWTSQPMCLSKARKLENLLKRQKGGQGLERIKQSEGS